MKELQAYEAIRDILKKKETCSIHDLVVFKQKYEKKHDNVYVSVCNNDIWYAQEYFADEFHWDAKREVFIKQESVKCPCCDKMYYKYPDIEKFEKIKNFVTK